MNGDGQIVGALAAEPGMKQTCYVAQPYSIMPMNSGKDYKARPVDVAQPLMAGGPVGGNQGGDVVVQPIAFSGQMSEVQVDFDMTSTRGAKNPMAVTHTLRGEGFDASEDGTGRGTPIVPVAYGFQPRIARNGRGDMGDVVNSLTSQAGETGKGDAAPCVAMPMAVRMTPVEAERLQGFPDGYTAIPWRNKAASECPDGPRYKALGNSWATPCAHWVGKRINDALKS